MKFHDNYMQNDIKGSGTTEQTNERIKENRYGILNPLISS